MKLDNSNGLLTQDLAVLNKNLIPCSRKFVASAMERHDDDLDSYSMILPHMSSFFFRRKMERVIAEHCGDPKQPTPYWTNLATAGNTGAASIYIMLDEYLRENDLSDGQRLLLFVPESGQFNFVMVSLTAVVR
jgi:3-oxoacyl-[acyl-carrier-protein] synthase-3